jgi:hypothetical protein
MSIKISDCLRSKRKFVTWLRRQKKKHGGSFTVGRARRKCNCPLARYVRSVTGKMISINDLCWAHGNVDFLDNDVRTFKVHPWASVFVDKVDDHKDGENISVSTALDIVKAL